MRGRAFAAALLVLAGLVTAGADQAAAAAPAPPPAAGPAGTALAVTTATAPVLTLPAGDGFHDRTTVRIVSGAPGTVDLLATKGRRTVHLADALPLARSSGAWRAAVHVSVAVLPLGSWILRTRRSADHGVHATSTERLIVGSGRAVHVELHPSATTLYPYRDSLLDAVGFTVAATDETGTVLPVTGSVRILDGARHRARVIPENGVVTVPVTGLPLGDATATVSLRAPGGVAERRLALRLAPTAVGSLRLRASTALVQPVVDGDLDTVTLSARGASSVGLPSEVHGAVTIALGGRTVATFPLPTGDPTEVVWDGHVDGAVIPGTYIATLSYRGPEGAASSRSTSLQVTADHLPYFAAQRLLAAADGTGNQQGLAVHGDTVYVGVDPMNGDGSRIDEYSLSTGQPTGSIGPLPIGHVAELDWSTTTGLLYAANGGPLSSAEVFAIDPSSDASDPTAGRIVTTWSLPSIGANAMVAVDDANDRMLVFGGQPGAYTVSQVGLTAPADGSTITPDPASLDTKPIAITGMPQGIALVDDEIWLWSSVTGANHIDREPLAAVGLEGASPAGITSALPAGLPASFDVDTPGEGEGIATDPATGAIYVGAHHPGRVAQLQAVTG